MKNRRSAHGHAARPEVADERRQEMETAAQKLVAKIVDEKEAQIKQELEGQIAQLNKDLSEKNSAALSRVTFELKSEQRERLQQALAEMELRHKELRNDTEDDPFDMWGGLDSRREGRLDGSSRGAN